MSITYKGLAALFKERVEAPQPLTLAWLDAWGDEQTQVYISEVSGFVESGTLQLFTNSANSQVTYSTGTDSLCATIATRETPVLNNVCFSYVFKHPTTGAYYCLGVESSTYSYGNLYLWKSTDKLNWTKINGGQPVMSQSSTPSVRYQRIFNSRIFIQNAGQAGEVWHLVAETTPATETDPTAPVAGLMYSHAIYNYASNTINFDANKSADWVIPNAINAWPIIIPEYNAVFMLHGNYDSPPDLRFAPQDGYWAATLRLSTAKLDTDLSNPASWTNYSSDVFEIFDPAHQCVQPCVVDMGAGKAEKTLLFYNYQQYQTNRVYSDLTVKEIYEYLPKTVPCTDSNVTWVGRWADKTINGTATKVIINAGNHVRFKFAGTYLALNCVVADTTYKPHIEYSVDGGPFTRTAVTSATTTIATGLPSGEHTVEIWCAGVQEDADRWNVQSGLMIQGFDIDGNGYLSPWNPSRKKMLVIGDSIAEGEFALGVVWQDQAHTNPVFTSATTSGRHSFIVQVCRNLGIDCWNHSWAGSRLSGLAVGNVPPTATNYLWKMAGIPADDPAFDAVYIEVVNNDYLYSPEQLTAAYGGLIDQIRLDQPQAVIYCMGPMGTYVWAHTEVIPAVAAAKGCVYVDTGRVAADPDYYESGWIDTWGIPFNNFGHPDVAGQTAIAAMVQPTVAATIEQPKVGAFTLPSVTLQPVVSAPTLAGNQRGSFTAPAVTLRPTVAAPALTGVQRGSFTMPTVTLTPTVTPPTLSGVSVVTVSGAFTLPAVTLRPIVTAPRLYGMTGGASIRAPSGQPLNLRRIDGTPFTILSI